MIISCMLPKIWSMTDNFLSFWVIFCPFTPLLIPKINICKKMYKKPADIILLHMCTINEDHMMSGFWNIRHDRQSFLSFWAIFCPLTLLTTWKIKILKNLKKGTQDIILHLCTTNDYHMMYGSSDMEHDRQNFFVTLRLFFAPIQKIKMLKKWKRYLEILSFYTCVPKWKSNDIWFLRYGAPQSEFVLILNHFLPFYTLNNPENQNSVKMQKHL